MQNKDVNVWLLVDDIDATFLNTKQERISVSAFFSACRNLVNSVTGVNVRASVRTDVWPILAQHDEALDKCEQYMLDILWSTQETGLILSKKIKSFFERTHGPLAPNQNVFNLVFSQPFHWGQKELQAFRPIHILSAGRPRWATQLCRLAGRGTAKKGHDKIGVGDIKACLKEYGRLRLSDLHKEHSHQCPAIELVLEAFAGGPTQYSTYQMLTKLDRDVIKRIGAPQIDGIAAGVGALKIAHFLYRIGFINGRDEKRNGGNLDFVRFEERPHLLSNKTNPDDGLDWEIHPAYRTVLRIPTSSDGPDPDEPVGLKPITERPKRKRHRGPKKAGFRSFTPPETKKK